MNESVLRALLQLFALITGAHDQEAIALARRQVAAYLAPKIAPTRLDEFLDQFEDYLRAFSRKTVSESEKKERKKSALSSVKVIMLCEEINEQLARLDKITVLLRLLEFVHKGGEISFRESGFLETLAHVFNIREEDYALLRHFVEQDGEPHPKLLSVTSTNTESPAIYRPGFIGGITVLILPDSAYAYFKYSGDEPLILNNKAVESDKIYPFDLGSILRSESLGVLYQNQVIQKHFSPQFEYHTFFRAKDIAFHFPDGTTGLHPLSLREESGTLIGIMGTSGAGKSTLLNILNGNFQPDTGSVNVNGLHVRSLSARQLIGYVPQDDLLIEELTVFENLYFSGRLCLPKLTVDELTARVDTLLQQVDMQGVRDLRVGHVLEKLISGGQRKRLNIALELLREPAVLFIDEPTSGLSSQDSEMVMQLLKHLTYRGMLVFTVIHQPSAIIYKMLDKLLLLDRGGFAVYYGQPMDAPSYFQERAGYIESADEHQQISAQVDPDEMLRILEARKVNEAGQKTNDRLRKPKEWYASFLTHQRLVHSTEEKIPENHSVNSYKTASGWRQFTIHFQRNVRSKIRNKTYLLLAFIETPILALIIGYFTRYSAGNETDPSAYVFFLNKNLPAFLFMLIVVALFVGLQISAEEIIRDRKILKRESFLNLSRASYINNKVLYLILLSALQTILLLGVGMAMLEIKGMFGYFFIVIFSTFVFANLLGLNISSALKSVVTIYILVPFLVVPQLLLSGVIVDFDTLQTPKNQGANTPVVADLMVARWAYEALAVAQFKHNAYQKPLFDMELVKQEALYQFSLRTPKLRSINQHSRTLMQSSKNSVELAQNLKLLHHEVSITNALFALKFDRVNELTPALYGSLTADLLDAWLNEIERQYRKVWQEADDNVELEKQRLAEQLGLVNSLTPLRDRHHNQKLEEQLKNKYSLHKIRQVDDVLVRTSDYIYRLPQHSFGRTHFYAPLKKLGSKYIDTVGFNVGVIWIFNLFLYFTLWHDTLRKLLRKK